MSSTYVQPILFGNFSLPPFQTELAINSHIMLSDIHRNVLTGQGGVDSQHQQSLGKCEILSTDNRILTIL